MTEPVSRTRDDRGQTSVIIIGFAVVVLLVVVVVVDAGAAYLKRQSLDSLADGAALYGADAAAEGRDVYRGGLDHGDLRLSADMARTAVRDYLRRGGAYDAHPGLRASVAIRDERVVVEVAAPVDLPLTLPGGPEHPVVRATGSAVVRPELRALAPAAPRGGPRGRRGSVPRGRRRPLRR